MSTINEKAEAIKTAIFYNCDSRRFEAAINEWLAKNASVTVISIQYHSVAGGFSAMIVYSERTRVSIGSILAQLPPAV